MTEQDGTDGAMSDAPGTGPPPRPLRSTGNRKTKPWLAPVLTAAIATQTRAIGIRRFVYLIIDPPPEKAGDALRKLVKDTDAKRLLRLVPDASGNIPAKVKRDVEKIVSDTLGDMREQGLADPRDILDNRSSEVGVTEWDDADEWLDAIRNRADDFQIVRQADQPRRHEVWSEAEDTLADIKAICDPFGVRAYSSSGNMTMGLFDRLGRRIVADVDGTVTRPTHIWYVGDCDPPGMFMPTRIKQRGEEWALRWWCERQIARKMPFAPRRLRWKHACRWAADLIASGDRTLVLKDETLAVPKFDVVVHRVAVTYADLNNRSQSTSTVSAAVATQYAKWWKPGEKRTLQVEGLSISVVAERVRKSLERSFDKKALDAVKTKEEAAHAAARTAIGRSGDDEADDDEEADDDDDE